jgi:UDP-glucose 4-epimerase
MKEAVLITGASGFLGFHIIEAALKKDLDVYVAVRKSSDVAHLKQLPISFVYPNFLDIDGLKADIELNKYSYIIHAAGVTKAKNQAAYDLVNATYTINLAKAAALSVNKIKKFVFISSLAAIGPLDTLTETIDENTLPRPVTAYGRSKLLAETQLNAINIPTVILRPTAVYGPREKDIFIVFKMIKKGFEMYMGNIAQQLSFIYATDIAALAVSSLFSEHTGAYNISDGNNYDRYALAKYIKKYLSKKTLKLQLPHPIIKVLAISSEISFKLMNKVPALNNEKLKELMAINWICSIEKAKTELGFNPVYNLETGVKESVAWYQKVKWL